MATHSSILAQRIPWTEEPVVYSPRSHKESDTGMLELVLLMRTNKAHLFARWAALYGVTPSRTRLKWLSSSSSFLLSWSLVTWNEPWKVCLYHRNWQELQIRWLSGKESAFKCRSLRRCRFDPWVGKISWRKWLPTPAYLPGKSHGQRSLAGYSIWGPRNWTWLSTHRSVSSSQES